MVNMYKTTARWCVATLQYTHTHSHTHTQLQANCYCQKTSDGPLVTSSPHLQSRKTANKHITGINTSIYDKLKL